jgi:uncharacterized tellurite resistance protein B-like protein
MKTMSSQELNEKKTHLHLLMMMARADERMHIKEDIFIRRVVKKLGLTDDDYDEVRFYPERFEFTLPSSEDERMEVFYNLVNLMKIDRKIVYEEIELCRQLGLLLGIHIPLTDDLIVIAEDYLGKNIPKKVLEEAFKKYMN